MRPKLDQHLEELFTGDVDDAITRNNNGYGVVDIISGEQVIPNSYEKIEDRIIEDDGNWIRVKFICKNSKGEYEIIEKQF